MAYGARYIEMDFGDLAHPSQGTLRFLGEIGVSGVEMHSNYTVNSPEIQNQIGAKGMLTSYIKENIIWKRAFGRDRVRYISRTGELLRSVGLATYYNGKLCYVWSASKQPQMNPDAKEAARTRWFGSNWHKMRDGVFYKTHQIADAVTAAKYIGQFIENFGIVAVIFNSAEHAAALDPIGGVGGLNPLAHRRNKVYKVISFLTSDCERLVQKQGGNGVSQGVW